MLTVDSGLIPIPCSGWSGNRAKLRQSNLASNLVPRLSGTRNVHACISSISRSGAEEPGNEASLAPSTVFSTLHTASTQTGVVKRGEDKYLADSQAFTATSIWYNHKFLGGGVWGVLPSVLHGGGVWRFFHSVLYGGTGLGCSSPPCCMGVGSGVFLPSVLT